MRCPKCSYLSYEEVERCRNCGYDFALAVPPETADAPTLDSPGEPRAWRGHTSRAPRSPTDLTETDEEGTAVDLPLFEPSSGHRESPSGHRQGSRREPPPMVIPPVSPPLVVRRTVDMSRPADPAAGRHPARGRSEPPALDFDEPAASRPYAEAPTPAEGMPWVSSDAADDAAGEERSAAGGRALAGAIDFGILAGIDVTVVWLTLRLLGLAWGDLTLLPLAPLVGFLFLLDTSYLVTFTTASGQTVGKMVAGLRVTTDGGGRVPFGHAVVRSVVLLLCALPAGLGLLPLFLDARGRGLHDRVASTRVISSR